MTAIMPPLFSGLPSGLPPGLPTSLPPGQLPESMIFIERDWLSCNQLLLFEDDGATLIDSGYVKHAARTVELVRTALAGRPLRRLINTHLHSDHCGGNAAIAQAFDCEILVPSADAAIVAAWDQRGLTYESTGQFCPRFRADGVVAPGQVLTLGGLPWTAHSAPGHDPHSLVFHNPTHRLLISADALWHNGFGIIFPELSGESGFAEQQAVLELMAGLPVETVIPGHGPVFTDVGSALRTAGRRLAAMRDDPRRNARNAIKALMKFLLLDRERMPIADLAPLAESASVLRDAAAQLGMASLSAVTTAIDELVAQGLARVEGGWLYDATPVAARLEHTT